MPQLLSLNRMAQRLGVPASWLKDQVHRNLIPCLHEGKVMLFDPEATERVLRKRAAEWEEDEPDVNGTDPDDADEADDEDDTEEDDDKSDEDPDGDDADDDGDDDGEDEDEEEGDDDED